VTSGWGPQHSDGLPGGLQVGRPGRYWWGIAAAAASTTLVGWVSRHDTTTVVLAVLIMVALAIGVGVHEAATGEQFACRRWVAFAAVLLLSPAAAVSYAAAYFGRRHWPRLAAARQTTAAARFHADQDQAAAAAAPEWPSLPGGFFGVSDAGQPVLANPRGAALVVGPPGSGKTTAVVTNSVAYAPAACVSTSIKTEVMAATAAVRAQRGVCWWFDPGGGGGSLPPEHVQLLRWNPLVDIGGPADVASDHWARALSVAARLAGATKPADGGSDHWIDKAETWLAVLLYAAWLKGGDLEQLARWCRAPDQATDEVETTLMEAEAIDSDRGAHYATSVLAGIKETQDKERSSIASTLSRIMKIYNNPAAVDAGTDPNFDPHAFVRSTDTVYITAPSSAQADYAPLIAGLLESIRNAQEARRQLIDLGQETQSAPLTFVLDEATNTAPIPLPAIASTAGGQGLHLVVAVQEPNQVRQRWGTAGEGFLTLFPDKLILSGMADDRWCDMLSKMSGEYDRMTTTLNAGGRSRQERIGVLFNTPTGASDSGPSVSYQTQRAAQLSVADIARLPDGRALYFSKRGWQLINLRFFDPARPIGSEQRAATGQGSGKGQRYIGAGPNWLGDRATPRRLLIAAGVAAVLVVLGALVIPALSGRHQSDVAPDSAPGPNPVSAPTDPPVSAATTAGPYWDRDWLRGYWSTQTACSQGFWVIEPGATASGGAYDLTTACFTPQWLTSINAQAATFVWGGAGVYALMDYHQIMGTGAGGDLQLVQIKQGCQNADEPLQLQPGALPTDCIAHPLTN
jgi:type IV secretion system protein VirD4